MKIVVTDSGFGGLGIAAELYESLKNKTFPDGNEIIFVNGLPDEEYGYNSIEDQQLKARVFNNLLEAIENKLKPDYIVIACNTLSVLLEQTDIYLSIKSKTIDIIKYGTDTVIQKYGTVSKALLAVLGTRTTIDSAVHRQYFEKYRNIFRNVLNISCTELVTAIENDSESAAVKNIIQKCTGEMNAAMRSGKYSEFFLILACTHFPYVEHIFRHYLNKYDLSYKIINPNKFMIRHLESAIAKHFRAVTDKSGRTCISVISKTFITDQNIKSISTLIKNISTETDQALKEYRHDSDFFTF